MASFVRRDHQYVLDHLGRPLILQGVGLNGWLLPEGYMFKSVREINRPRHFYAWTEELLGKKDSDTFWEAFRDRFITEEDIKWIKSEGYNSVRVPFDYAVLFEESETEETLKPKASGFRFLDRLIAWCHDHEVYVILDLHGAPGGQTGANIDNSKADHPDLFVNEIYQKQTINLWTFLANRYKDEVFVAAYDLLNEPLPNHFKMYNDKLVPLYEKIIKGIRNVDPYHMIQLEGTHWATEVDVFDRLLDDNSMIHFHKYWSPFDTKSIQPYLDIREKLDIPLIMGEGGEHYLLWYSGAFKLFHEWQIGFNFWSYKKMSTDNSLVSFDEPALWQSVLKKDPSLTKEEIEETFETFLKMIDFTSCTYLPHVTNHLMLKDSFESFGIGFDVDKKRITSYIDQEPEKRSFRKSEDVMCVDHQGKEMTPNFWMSLRPGKNTKFPYLKVQKNREYPYSFYVSEKKSTIQIKIQHQGFTSGEFKVDGQIHEPNYQGNRVIKLKVKLNQGWHRITVKCLDEAMIKIISFTS
mgnify:CR=1 FL=1